MQNIVTIESNIKIPYLLIQKDTNHKSFQWRMIQDVCKDISYKTIIEKQIIRNMKQVQSSEEETRFILNQFNYLIKTKQLSLKSLYVALKIVMVRNDKQFLFWIKMVRNVSQS